MNLKRFTGRTSRDAMQKVKASFGDDAIVLSTKPCAEGVEIIAMASDAMVGIEKQVPPEAVAAAPAWDDSIPVDMLADDDLRPGVQVNLRQRASTAQEAAPPRASSVQEDVQRLAMSTLSFQDYVRERMLKRRQHALKGREGRDGAKAVSKPSVTSSERTEPSFMDPVLDRGAATAARPASAPRPVTTSQGPRSAPAGQPVPAAPGAPTTASASTRMAKSLVSLTEEVAAATAPAPAATSSAAASPADRDALRIDHLVAESPRPAAWPKPSAAHVPAAPASVEMMHELREMKDLIEERFGAIAFMQRLQRSPAQATVSQKLLECGFSPALVRKLIDGMPEDIRDGSKDPIAWATRVLEHNLSAAEREVPIENQGGVFALIGSTGTGKTTSTAKIAAAFAAKHGANNLGLVTLDAYRVGAHEQLRTYGRILGVPVHTAHDRVALEDLLDLLSGKKMVLIDTAGIAQRDTRTKELLEMISHRSINRLLVINAASQGETIEDVMQAYRANTAKGVVIAKLDEAVKLAPALDALIRHHLPVFGVANGQRVPEDWHCLSSSALIQRALRHTGSAAYRLDTEDLNLIFALSSSPAPGGGARA